MKKTKRDLLLVTGIGLVFSLALFVLSHFDTAFSDSGLLSFLVRFFLMTIPLLLVVLLITILKISTE